MPLEVCVSCKKGSLLLLVKGFFKILYEPIEESGYPNVRKCMKNSRFACVIDIFATPRSKYVREKYYACGSLRLMEERLSFATVT